MFIFQKGLYCVVTVTLSSLGFAPVLIWGSAPKRWCHFGNLCWETVLNHLSEGSSPASRRQTVCVAHLRFLPPSSQLLLNLLALQQQLIGRYNSRVGQGWYWRIRIVAVMGKCFLAWETEMQCGTSPSVKGQGKRDRFVKMTHGRLQVQELFSHCHQSPI